MSVAQVIKEKLVKIEARKAEKPGDSEHAMRVLEDYELYFQGGNEIAAALGADEADASRLQRAASLIETEITAIEQRLALEADLG